MSSPEDPFAVGGGDSGELADLALALELARRCEEIACGLNEQYRTNKNDTCGTSGLSGDVGIQTRQIVEFEAERNRERDEAGRYGEVLETEYEISTQVERYEIRAADLPSVIRNEIVRRKLCKQDDINEPAPIFMLGYELAIDLTSEGEHESQMNVYVGSDGRVAYLKQKAVHRAITTLLQAETQAAAAANTELDMLAFEQMFSGDEATELSSLSEEIDRRSKIVLSFFKDVRDKFDQLKKNPHALGHDLLDKLLVPKKTA